MSTVDIFSTEKYCMVVKCASPVGNNECRCVVGVRSPKPCVMYGSYISVHHTVSEYLI